MTGVLFFIALWKHPTKTCWDVSNDKRPVFVVNYRVGASERFISVNNDFIDENGETSNAHEFESINEAKLRYTHWGKWCDATDGMIERVDKNHGQK